MVMGDLYLYISRRMRWVGLVACMGENKNACRVLVWKFEERDSGCGQEENTKLDLKERYVVD
jgi:hypothetical protein